MKCEFIAANHSEKATRAARSSIISYFDLSALSRSHEGQVLIKEGLVRRLSQLSLIRFCLLANSALAAAINTNGYHISANDSLSNLARSYS